MTIRVNGLYSADYILRILVLHGSVLYRHPVLQNMVLCNVPFFDFQYFMILITITILYDRMMVHRIHILHLWYFIVLITLEQVAQTSYSSRIFC